MNHKNSFGSELLSHILAGTPADENPLRHIAELPAQKAEFLPWPQWAPEAVINALTTGGISTPWRHQVEAAEHAFKGQHVVIATGTASGKSLAYQLPILSALNQNASARALYLAPTKALGNDQLRAAQSIVDNHKTLTEIYPSAFDGDSATEIRQWARTHSRWIFTNPDMLHIGILHNHARWSHFFRNLHYVVVDECHYYRGVFGSHISLILRRLLRLAARYGAKPVVVLASATTSEPGKAAAKLIGSPCVEVTKDHSPHGPRTIALWEPALLSTITGENGAPIRRSAGTESARIMADLVIAGARTLTFVRSRRGAELTALATQTLLAEVSTDLSRRVAAYRAGYLAEDRRELEHALGSGDLLGVATTNALELGVDIAGLDAVVVAGFPGTIASFWQQAGRAGRRAEGSLVVLVARDDPLDTYLVNHPSTLLDKPIEATITDPKNPYILESQLLCFAQELPISFDEAQNLGALEVLNKLAAEGQVRRRAQGWFISPGLAPHAAVDIRGSIGTHIAIVEAETGRMLGTIDSARAPATVHPGAVHIHQGESFIVDELDLALGVALVHLENPEWTTFARETTTIKIIDTYSERIFPAVTVALTHVSVTHQVVGYLRKLASGEILDAIELEMPPRTLNTKAVMYTITPEFLEKKGISRQRIPGSLHAAEHAAIGLLPLIATCDRWDIGGVSTALNADTGLPSVFVYDGHPGGAGFADRGYECITQWLSATREAVLDCECTGGCPSCVQSPKCGNGNSPLDKDGAIITLTAVLAAISSGEISSHTVNNDLS
ncbi:MAG: DEAD/DEAH box helicase [Mycobacteriaceae bacterium]